MIAFSLLKKVCAYTGVTYLPIFKITIAAAAD
jgi:hypothetical protein